MVLEVSFEACCLLLEVLGLSRVIVDKQVCGVGYGLKGRVRFCFDLLCCGRRSDGRIVDVLFSCCREEQWGCFEVLLRIWCCEKLVMSLSKKFGGHGTSVIAVTD